MLQVRTRSSPSGWRVNYSESVATVGSPAGVGNGQIYDNAPKWGPIQTKRAKALPNKLPIHQCSLRKRKVSGSCGQRFGGEVKCSCVWGYQQSKILYKKGWCYAQLFWDQPSHNGYEIRGNKAKPKTTVLCLNTMTTLQMMKLEHQVSPSNQSSTFG